MTALVASVLGASLLGSAHCAAMCGAFACTAADVDSRAWARLRASATYHGARLVAYLALGAIAGAAGAGVDAVLPWRTFGRPAAVIAGTVLVAWGVVRALAWFGVRVPGSGGVPGASWAAAALRRGGGGSPSARAALLGLVAPLLPCGWLYAFVAPAAASGSAWNGAVVMAVFWVGTVPALAAVALGLHRAFGPARRVLPLITAVAFVAIGTVAIVRAAHDAPAGTHSHAPARGDVRR